MILPPIIGIAGPSGSGKSYISVILGTDHYYRQESFASPINRMLVAIYGSKIPRDKEAPMEDGLCQRSLMRSLGDWGRAHRPDFWIAQAEKRIRWIREFSGTDTRFVFGDVRYDNEADWIRAQGGQVWRIVGRPYNREHSSEMGIEPHDSDKVLDVADYWGNDDALKQRITELLT